ncbi:AN1-type zinc finger domain-containing protein [Archaeoglobus veneficus]|uniref:AN1-type domain-containing protein n=1 Tax=Archaeoglobus veneficus (strain DSM 11195 / SNP6) TaxID=693661 RepID=F2KSP9_ARCVS|nr:AN1-type zinc finger domain-containing protein [Archaeoglobus veneficus]AEA48119.1 hypothetical protein Arcve_2130 [Archaeoglobus veneficus SNP6]
MSKCQFCGKNVAYPFKCRYCGGLFCEDHRLPPSHNCVNIEAWRSKTPPFVSRVKEPSLPKSKIRPTPYSVPVRTQKKKKSSKIKYLILLSLLVLFMGYFDQEILPFFDKIKEGGILSEIPSIPPVNIEAVKKTIEPDVYRNCIPIAKASGERVCLVNYKNATDPTWDELISFLKKDDTDKLSYDYASFVCADFAEMLHNNAEAAGIRAGFVAIDFVDGIGHALNVFNTTDKGLVYVDCTGGGFITVYQFVDGKLVTFSPPHYDKIAYVVVGKEYGLISIDKAKSPEYWFYEDYKQKWIEYKKALEEYNKEAEEFNKKVEEYEKELRGRTVIHDPVEYAKLKRMYDELKEEKEKLDKKYKELEEQKELLGGFYWESLGIVSNIEIYW